jgi:hypothetical protein
MNRDGVVFTVSVTSIAISSQGLVMEYLDIQNNQRFSEQMMFESSWSGK